ncbi:hypothetical protein B0H16DRAFT_1696093 [Mycena metata]|uniref:Uncharacterized protein n=1 Tax=Mycena metata TaxID=1033252 RepID=A0AAD7I2I4_9AGAR|nr:hypothetical protein B0H16DRAFT_1696093 [Mycena metata]
MIFPLLATFLLFSGTLGSASDTIPIIIIDYTGHQNLNLDLIGNGALLTPINGQPGTGAASNEQWMVVGTSPFQLESNMFRGQYVSYASETVGRSGVHSQLVLGPVNSALNFTLQSAGAAGPNYVNIVAAGDLGNLAITSWAMANGTSGIPGDSATPMTLGVWTQSFNQAFTLKSFPGSAISVIPVANCGDVDS